MHQKLQFCHLTHFYYGVASQVWDTITTHIESIPITQKCVINDTSAKNFLMSHWEQSLLKNQCVPNHYYSTIYSYYAFVHLFFSFIGLLLSHQNLLRLIQYFCTTLYPLTLKGFLTPLFSWLNVSLLSFWDSYLLHAFISHIIIIHVLFYQLLIYQFLFQ